VRSFPLFVAGTTLHGVYQATAQYYRFAAADLASPTFRPKAISWVLTGGIAAAIFGSMLVIATTDLFAPVTFAGCYMVMALLAAAAILLLTFVDIPVDAGRPADGSSGRPLAVIARQPRYIVAVMVGMLTYGIMNLVMTAAPVAMIGCGYSVKDSSWAVQWHALAMFVPSFFTGSLILRFGVEKVASAGMALLILAGLAGLMGIRFENFAIGLILLGLGWNFGYIGATTMLTTTYEPAERNKAQGLNDLMVFGTTALSSLSAGRLLADFGWNAVNIAVFPMVALALAMIVWLVRHPARRQA
jgi:predicted MFS family arabinose efflux permease